MPKVVPNEKYENPVTATSTAAATNALPIVATTRYPMDECARGRARPTRRPPTIHVPKPPTAISRIDGWYAAKADGP